MLILKKFASANWQFFLIFLIASIIIIKPLGRDLLQDWDECLYAVNAIEMKASGNFLVNFWNGQPDLQKPPLYTWILTTFYSFGTSEFTTRIFNVIALLGLLTSVYIFSKKYFSVTVGILSILLLLTSEVLLASSSHASTDVGFTLFIFLGFWSWIASLRDKRFSYLAGLFFGLSVLIKGIGTIQILIALFLSLFINFKKERLLNFIRLIVIFAAVSVPWHIVVYNTYGYEFFRVYFLENIVKRAQYPIEFHRERWYFYLVLFLKEFSPWIFFAFTLPLYYLKNMRNFLSLKKIQNELKNKEVLFIIFFLILIPLFAITRVQTRIAWYAVPLYPFLAIFIAYNIEFLYGKIKSPRFLNILITVIAINAFIAFLLANRFFDTQRRVAPREEAIFSVGTLPHKELRYLVAGSERHARGILPPTEQIPQTWTFGGHPCAVFYSGKRVRYYYFVDEFARDLNIKSGLFMIPNTDRELLRDLPVKILFKNSQFIVFEKIRSF